MHLGVIGLHPLHCPPFVKVCFTCKHSLGPMGLCISHLVANLMLGLRQMAFILGYVFEHTITLVHPLPSYQ
jgi:hypothetical protein